MRPVNRFGNTWLLRQIERAEFVHECGGLSSEALGGVGHAGPDDRDLTVEIGQLDPHVEAAALECLVEFSRAVRGQEDDRATFGFDRADLGDRDLKVRQQLEQKRFELVIGAIDLVDQEHGWNLVVAGNRVEQWSALQEARPEQLVKYFFALPSVTGRLKRADIQHLARVGPVVECMGDVDSFVTLETNQSSTKRVGNDLCELGLANARLAFEQHGLAELESKMHRRGEAAVGQIGPFGERLLHAVDRCSHLVAAHRASLGRGSVRETIPSGERMRIQRLVRGAARKRRKERRWKTSRHSQGARLRRSAMTTCSGWPSQQRLQRCFRWLPMRRTA